MTDRDEQGRYTVDPVQAAYTEHLERNQGKLARIFGTPAEDPPADQTPSAGSFDGGRQGAPPEPPPAGMDEVLRDAVSALRGGAHNVTINHY